MRTNTPYGALIIALVLVATSSFSCGLGTEVGNGRKPGQDDETFGNQPGAADTPTTTTTDGAQPEAAKSQSDPGSPNEANVLSSASLDLLFNECATPLADDLLGPFALVQQKTNASGLARRILVARSADESSWSVSEGAKLLYTVAPIADSSSFAAKVENAQPQPVNLEPSCGAVAETPDFALPTMASKQTKMSVEIAIENRLFELVWFKTSGDSPTAASTLTRIEVTELAGKETTVWIAAP